MANLNESAVWVDGIYQIETSDPVMGGPNGIANKQAGQIGNRTQWLKNKIAEEVAAIGTSKANKASTLAGYGITNAYTSAQVDALLANKADKTITIAAGTGLLSGGDLSSSRTLSIDKATVAQLTAGTADKVLTADIAKPALDAKANGAITLTAGTGLTGLGNLTANRTVAIDKATAAQLTEGTANKVITADILAPFLNKVYTDVTSSRSLGVNYTNNTGYEITVHVDGRVDGGASKAVASVNGVVVNRLSTISQTGTSIIGTFSFVVPNGATYQVEGMGTAHSSAPYKWVEYR